MQRTGPYADASPCPQAFTHLAQVNALMHLIHAEQNAARGFSMPHQIVT